MCCGKNGRPLIPPPPGQGDFPSAAEGDFSAGNALSSSTNHSGGDGLRMPAPDATSGAAFIRPPAISNYGSVDISYQVEIAPGRAGLQPSLSLAYSSSGGDGIAGTGWSLSTGLGVVSRMSRYGPIRYDGRDMFSYNGKRLIKVSGPEGSEEGAYRMETGSPLVRLEYAESGRGGLWRVREPSGTVSFYGMEEDQRVYDPGDRSKTYIWNFSRAVDLNGNYMHAVYDYDEYESTRMPYLREIRYTGNEREGSQARQYVRFKYRRRDNCYVSRAPGFLMTMDRILSEIEVGWDNPRGLTETTLWAYSLEYEESEDSSRPILKTIRSTRKTTIPEFEYANPAHGFGWHNAANPLAGTARDNPLGVQYFEGDFNGDGLSDMVFFDPATGDWNAAEAVPGGGYRHVRYGNRYRGYRGPDNILWFKGNVTGDYNGDGRSDIAFYLPRTGEFIIAEHDGRSFRFTSYGSARVGADPFRCEWFTGDFDGNGLSDALLFDESNGKWVFMKNGGGYFQFLDVSSRFRNLFRSDYRPDQSRNSASTADASEHGLHRDKVSFFTGDFSGDGLTDVAVYDARSGEWWVGENTPVDYEPGFTLRWYLYRTFAAPEQALFANERFSGDFNGDGVSDILIFDRARGEWWIGSAKDRAFEFRVYSRMEGNEDITRWIQGDFNGDGRTDVGYYSSSSGSFRVGEAAPKGFRWRTYTTLKNCPDPERILAAPLPRDEIVPVQGKGVAATPGGTFPLAYTYDGNYHTDRGERAFSGCFTGGAAPELLVYSRRDNRMTLRRPDGSAEEVLAGIDLEREGASLLFNGRTQRFGGKDMLFLAECEASTIGNGRCRISMLRHRSGSTFGKDVIAEIQSGAVSGFDPARSLFLIDAFRAGSAQPQLVVCDDAASTPAFVLYDGGPARRLHISGDLAPSFFREARSGATMRFFSGEVTGGKSQIIVVDSSAGSFRWYLGTVTDDMTSIVFRALSGSPKAPMAGIISSQIVGRGTYAELQYAASSGSAIRFYRFGIDSSQSQPKVWAVRELALEAGTTFQGEYDHEDRPVVRSRDGLKRLNLDTGGLENLLVEQSIARGDLMTKVYPIQWIQGDYNGDGITDLGFFHVAERNWYFALSTGVRPDVLTRVKNGIGGEYEFEYVNSTSFDNTDEDGTPRLAANHLVCSRMTLHDGLGRSYATSYEYEAGCSFSSFIDGFKEADYFGFGKFTITLPGGMKTVREYHADPYEDFRMNRALAGALKTERSYGTDGSEYTRADYEYRVRKIAAPGASGTGYYAEIAATNEYRQGALFATSTSDTEYSPGAFEMRHRTVTTTDRYNDAVHAEVSATEREDYEYLEAANITRSVSKKRFAGSVNETTSEFAYDGKGNLAEERTRYTGGSLAHAADTIRRYAYDGYGNPVRLSDESGNPSRTVEREYDPVLFQFVCAERVAAGRHTLVTKREIDYAGAFGKTTRLTEPNGNSSYVEFDAFGRPVAEKTDTERGIEVTAEYSYMTGFPAGARLVRDSGAKYTAAVAAYHDGLGRFLHRVDRMGEKDGRRFVKSGAIVYDAAGRIIRRSQPEWTGEGDLEHYAPPRGEKNPTITGYDPAGRVSRVTFPADAGEDASRIDYEYDGPWTTVESHSAGRNVRTVRNSRGLVLYVEESGRGDDGRTVSARLGFAYDTAGNRVKKMDLNDASMDIAVPASLFTPGGGDSSSRAVACWRHDGFGRVVEESDPDRGYSRMEYTPFGEVMRREDARGLVTEYEYDSLGRIVAKRLPAGEGIIRYAYDEAAGSDNALGRLVAIDEPVQRLSFSYDRMGRVSRERRQIVNAEGKGPHEEYETAYDHDLLGRTSLVVYPRDRATGTRLVARYEHCSAGVTGLSIDTGSGERALVRRMEYNEFGQVAALERGNGTNTSYRYDVRGRLSRLVTTTVHNGATWTVQDATYSFGGDNRIRSVESAWDCGPDGAFPGVVRNEYAYDGLGRLVRAAGGHEAFPPATRVPDGDDAGGVGGPPSGVGTVKSYESKYAYSPSGNLLEKTHTGGGSAEKRWTYTYRGHAAIAVHGPAGTALDMDYDRAGNMVQKRDHSSGMSMEADYDSRGRMREVRDPDAKLLMGRYDYDDRGHRVRKIARLDRSDDGEMREILSPDIHYTVERKAAAEGDAPADAGRGVNHVYLNGVRIAAVTPNGRARYYLTDQVDSVRVVTDDRGMIVSRMEYLPYGETWFSEGNTSHAPKYNSQELDRETGLYFYNARHYDPGLARFVSPDSVIDGEYTSAGWNRYMYCHGNPVLYRDPTGHFFQELAGLGMVAYAGKKTYDYLFGDEKKNSDKDTGSGDPSLRGGNEAPERINENPPERKTVERMAKKMNQGPEGTEIIEQTLNVSLVKKPEGGNSYCAFNSVFLGIAMKGRIRPTMDAYKEFLLYAREHDAMVPETGELKENMYRKVLPAYGLKIDWKGGFGDDGKKAWPEYKKMKETADMGAIAIIKNSGHYSVSYFNGPGKEDTAIDTGDVRNNGMAQSNKASKKVDIGNFQNLGILSPID